jgi:hypothetical protein
VKFQSPECGAVKIIQEPVQTFRKTVEVDSGGEISWTVPHPDTGVPLMLVGIENIDRDLSEEYSALVEIEMDLSDAAVALDRMCNFDVESDSDVRHAMFGEAVISYCRPFNKGYGRMVRLHDAAPWILDTGIEKKWHEKIVGIRDKIIAHSDRNHPLRQIRCFVAVDAFPRPTFLAVSQMKSQVASISNDDAAAMRAHILAVADRVRSKVKDLADQITRKFIALPPDHFVNSD